MYSHVGRPNIQIQEFLSCSRCDVPSCRTNRQTAQNHPGRRYYHLQYSSQSHIHPTCLKTPCHHVLEPGSRYEPIQDQSGSLDSGVYSDGDGAVVVVQWGGWCSGGVVTASATAVAVEAVSGAAASAAAVAAVAVATASCPRSTRPPSICQATASTVIGNNSVMPTQYQASAGQ